MKVKRKEKKSEKHGYLNIKKVSENK